MIGSLFSRIDGGLCVTASLFDGQPKPLIAEARVKPAGKNSRQPAFLLPAGEGGSRAVIVLPAGLPARNTIMLSLALAWAEVLGSDDIFVGINAVDYSGYPDCRPEYLAAFEKMANLATKSGVEGHKLRIHAPLINLSKADIIRTGAKLGVDYALTVSCYQADELGRACGVCDSCRLRAEGFAAAGVADPTLYCA